MRTIGLFGNPNSGKTSLFNILTGLRQKTGNFPGVTVDKKSGIFKGTDNHPITIIDYPGTYSLFANSEDEIVVLKELSGLSGSKIDAIVYIADINKLDKHLLLFDQIKEFDIPTLLVLNMIDTNPNSLKNIDIKKLEESLQTQIILTSARTNEGIEELKGWIQQDFSSLNLHKRNYEVPEDFIHIVDVVASEFPQCNDYQKLLIGQYPEILVPNHTKLTTAITQIREKDNIKPLDFEWQDTISRYERFEPLVQQATHKKIENNQSAFSSKLDRILTGKISGPILFFLLMSFIFQAIYAWSGYPMDAIESLFSMLSQWVSNILPEGWFTDLLTEGIIAGLGGVLVFIPQIAILFFLISLLEEVGYMARAAFMFDRIMQYFGLNGRSIVALISGAACAIPAIMSARTISNWKERLITILVTPFISCSARIPVYAVLIGFAVPEKTVGGFFNLQGLAFSALYFLGIFAALGFALVLKWILKSKQSSFLLLELPDYKLPDLKNVGLTVWDKVTNFVVEAGKIILIISVILWGLSSYGPQKRIDEQLTYAKQEINQQQMSEPQAQALLTATRLENSYAGILGKTIEPIIKPLGFDWKMGIALITSFAAREVFVGTMATLYAVGDTESEIAIKERLAQEINPKTGQPVYSVATALSLILFYVFAMQCMSTLAVVKRETKSWKWPVLQFGVMTLVAYVASLICYQVLS